MHVLSFCFFLSPFSLFLSPFSLLALFLSLFLSFLSLCLSFSHSLRQGSGHQRRLPLSLSFFFPSLSSFQSLCLTLSLSPFLSHKYTKDLDISRHHNSLATLTSVLHTSQLLYHPALFTTPTRTSADTMIASRHLRTAADSAWVEAAGPSDPCA